MEYTDRLKWVSGFGTHENIFNLRDIMGFRGEIDENNGYKDTQL